MKTIIEISKLGKKYPIRHNKARYGTFRDTISDFIHHPFRVRQERETFWALKNIDLTINKGDIVGIIGKNGAGKSTLLKILSGITKPSEGKIKLWGRVSSLLEVGTGFHPELTGRENIFLNGVILGMTRKEVAKKFDEIVAFVDIEKFLDTQVKHYSSGMYVRLAFAVAAHLEPDILIVDEVLAVGDVEFQKKCLGKMETVSKKEGRTVLFVSHNLLAIKQLCQKCLLLENGQLNDFGETSKIIDQYTKKKSTSLPISNYKPSVKKQANILKVTILDSANRPSLILPIDRDFYIEVEFEIEINISRSVICLFIFSNDGDLLLLASDGDQNGKLNEYKIGKYRTKIRIPAFSFNVGQYNFNIAIERPYIEYIDLKEKINFEIIDTDSNPRSIILGGRNLGKMAKILEFSRENI